MTIKIERETLESLLTMAAFVEARDASTGGHAWRVSLINSTPGPDGSTYEDLKMWRAES